MKNADRWQPSKYVYRRGRLMASRDVGAVSVGSRLMADLVAGVYQEYLPQHATGHLLDLGCGEVPLYAAYRDYVDGNTCVDWGNTAHRMSYLDREADLTQPLPFGDAEFDTVILSDVLEHIPEPVALCKEIARVLAPGGKLLMNVPFYYPLHEKPYDFYRYSEFALRRFIDGAGLELVILKPVGGTFEVLADIFAKHIQFVPGIGRSLASFAQYLVRIFGLTRLGRRVSTKTGEAFPYAYFLVARKSA